MLVVFCFVPVVLALPRTLENGLQVIEVQNMNEFLAKSDGEHYIQPLFIIDYVRKSKDRFKDFTLSLWETINIPKDFGDGDFGSRQKNQVLRSATVGFPTTWLEQLKHAGLDEQTFSGLVSVVQKINSIMIQKKITFSALEAMPSPKGGKIIYEQYGFAPHTVEVLKKLEILGVDLYTLEQFVMLLIKADTFMKNKADIEARNDAFYADLFKLGPLVKLGLSKQTYDETVTVVRKIYDFFKKKGAHIKALDAIPISALNGTANFDEFGFPKDTVLVLKKLQLIQLDKEILIDFVKILLKLKFFLAEHGL